MNKGSIWTKIIAGVALAIMVFSTVGGVLYYLLAG